MTYCKKIVERYNPAISHMADGSWRCYYGGRNLFEAYIDFRENYSNTEIRKIFNKWLVNKWLKEWRE